MTITVVCDVLGEENNGTTIAAMNLIRHLRQRGHTVRILCADRSRTGEEDVFVVPSRSFGKLLNAYVSKVGVTLAKPEDETVRAALDGVDHVHIMLPFALGRRAMEIARENGISVTAGFHMQAENFTSYIKLNKIQPLNRAVYRYVYRRVYRHVDAIHYPTQFIRDVFEKNAGHPTRGYIISNGVHSYVRRRESERPAELEGRIVILTTGRYAREKSQDTLIKAVKYSKYRDRIQLILGGQGVKEKRYRKLAKGLPIAPIFRFYSRAEIIDVLNYADLYVHPAEAELEGISCLEAITCGKLTVVSDSKLSATKEFAIDEKCIFRKRNPRDLARVIDYWIEHPEERREYEERYIRSAISYDQDVCMQQMEKMMTEVSYDKRKDKANGILRG